MTTKVQCKQENHASFQTIKSVHVKKSLFLRENAQMKSSLHAKEQILLKNRVHLKTEFIWKENMCLG